MIGRLPRFFRFARRLSNGLRVQADPFSQLTRCLADLLREIPSPQLLPRDQLVFE
jgi:hypothetical protein